MAANSIQAEQTNNFETWEDTEPQNNLQAVQCEIFGGEMICTGTFFMLVGAGSKIVRLLGFEHDPSTSMVRCFGNLFRPFHGTSPPYSSATAHSLLQGLHDREVVSTKNKVHFSLNDDVADLAFVFLEEQVVHEGLVLHGISNAFICRFRSDNSPVADFSSFPCDSPSYKVWSRSFPRRVWDGIKGIQKMFRQLLSSCSEKQGHFDPNKKNTIQFTCKVWNYILMRLNLLDVASTATKQSTINQKLLSGLSRILVRKVEVCERIWVTTNQQLLALQRIFGIFILFGVCLGRPKLGEILHIHENFSINVIAASQENDRELLQQNNLPHPCKVEMIMGQTELVVSLSYVLYLIFPAIHSAWPFSISHKLYDLQQFFLLLLYPSSSQVAASDGVAYKVVNLQHNGFVLCKSVNNEGGTLRFTAKNVALGIIARLKQARNNNSL